MIFQDQALAEVKRKREDREALSRVWHKMCYRLLLIALILILPDLVRECVEWCDDRHMAANYMQTVRKMMMPNNKTPLR